MSLGEDSSLWVPLESVGKPPFTVHVTIISLFCMKCIRTSTQLLYKPLPGKTGQRWHLRACGSRLGVRAVGPASLGPLPAVGNMQPAGPIRPGK